jgi:WD40 repeat protein
MARELSVSPVPSPMGSIANETIKLQDANNDRLRAEVDEANELERYRIASKVVWLGEVEAPDETAATEKVVDANNERRGERHCQGHSFGPDGRRILTASDDETTRVWDVSRTKAIARKRAVVLPVIRFAHEDPVATVGALSLIRLVSGTMRMPLACTLSVTISPWKLLRSWCLKKSQNTNLTAPILTESHSLLAMAAVILLRRGNGIGWPPAAAGDVR